MLKNRTFIIVIFQYLYVYTYLKTKWNTYLPHKKSTNIDGQYVYEYIEFDGSLHREVYKFTTISKTYCFHALRYSIMVVSLIKIWIWRHHTGRYGFALNMNVKNPLLTLSIQHEIYTFFLLTPQMCIKLRDERSSRRITKS